MTTFGVRGRDRERDRVALVVPYAAVVRSGDAKPVRARPKIGVLHLAVVDDLSPVRVLAVKLEAKVHLLRRHQAERCVIDCQIANVGSQPQTGARVDSLAVCREFLDVDRRRNGVRVEVSRIDDAEQSRNDKEDLAVLRFRDLRPLEPVERKRTDPVSAVERRHREAALRIGDHASMSDRATRTKAHRR
jgi:hypothetical protein